MKLGQCVRVAFDTVVVDGDTTTHGFFTGYVAATTPDKVAYLEDGLILATSANTKITPSVFQATLDHKGVARLAGFARGLGRKTELSAFLDEAYRRGIWMYLLLGRKPAVDAWRANLENDFTYRLSDNKKRLCDEQTEALRLANRLVRPPPGKKRLRREQAEPQPDGPVLELGRDLIEAGKTKSKRRRFDTLRVQRVYGRLFTPGGRRSALFAEENLELMRQRIHEAAPLARPSRRQYALATRAIAAGYTYKVYDEKTDPAEVARFAWWLYTVMRTIKEPREEAMVAPEMVAAIHRVCSSQRALYLPPFADGLWKVFFAAMMSMAIEGSPPFRQPGGRCAPDPLCFYDE